MGLCVGGGGEGTCVEANCTNSVPEEGPSTEKNVAV